MAAKEVDVIDLDDYPDKPLNDPEACGMKTIDGMQYLCVDPQCSKHQANKKANGLMHPKPSMKTPLVPYPVMLVTPITPPKPLLPPDSEEADIKPIVKQELKSSPLHDLAAEPKRPTPTLHQVSAEQLRDQTKLSKAIVDKYYDVLVKQPFVTLEHINLEHVLDESLLKKYKQTKSDSISKKKCPFCYQTFVFEKSLVYHVNMYHQKSELPFKCHKCDMSFFLNNSLATHVQQKHGDIIRPMEECPVCHKLYAKSFLPTHLQRKHKAKGVIKCMECDTRCDSSADLGYHMKIYHQKTVPLNVSNRSMVMKNGPRCKRCSALLSFDHTCKMCASDVVQNMAPISDTQSNSQVNDPSDPYVTCPQCQSKFSGSDTLDRHYRDVHGEEHMPHHCQICERGFLQESAMRSHVHYRHRSWMDPKKSVNTEELEKRVAIRSLLRDILMKQRTGQQIERTDKDKTVCPQCKEHFAHQRDRDDHFRKVHGANNMPHSCDICHKGYFDVCVVLKHYRLTHPTVYTELIKSLDNEVADSKSAPHSDVSPVDLSRKGHLSCPGCGKLFGCTSKRDKHYRAMHGEQTMPYKCSKCGRGYLTQVSLSTHRNSLCRYKQMKAMMEPKTSDFNVALSGSDTYAKSTQTKNVNKHEESIQHDSAGTVESAHASNMSNLESRIWKSRPASPKLADSIDVPPPVERPICSECGKQFLTMHGLEWHTKDKHNHTLTTTVMQPESSINVKDEPMVHE